MRYEVALDRHERQVLVTLSKESEALSDGGGIPVTRATSSSGSATDKTGEVVAGGYGCSVALNLLLDV